MNLINHLLEEVLVEHIKGREREVAYCWSDGSKRKMRVRHNEGALILGKLRKAREAYREQRAT